MKKKSQDDELAKLVNLTKLIKLEKIKVSPKGPPRSANKWRAAEPKFSSPPKEKPENVVKAGGMDVDPSLQEAYENWRKDKLEEQNYRRIQAARKAEAAKKKRQADDLTVDLPE